MVNEDIIKEVYSVLESRRDNPLDSYTSNLMKNDVKKAEDKILEKVGEECAEFIIASKNNQKDEIIYESADLIFHTLLLLVYKNISIDELLNEFEKRNTKE